MGNDFPNNCHRCFFLPKCTLLCHSWYKSIFGWCDILWCLFECKRVCLSCLNWWFWAHTACCPQHTSISRMVIVLLFVYVLLWGFCFEVEQCSWWVVTSVSFDVWGSASGNVLFCFLMMCHFRTVVSMSLVSATALSVQLEMLFHGFSPGESISITALHCPCFCTVVKFYLN